nr:PREDICTED: uncharacterized protein LOC109043679 [Bemisia tabaci]
MCSFDPRSRVNVGDDAEALNGAVSKSRNKLVECAAKVKRALTGESPRAIGAKAKNSPPPEEILARGPATTETGGSSTELSTKNTLRRGNSSGEPESLLYLFKQNSDRLSECRNRATHVSAEWFAARDSSQSENECDSSEKRSSNESSTGNLDGCTSQHSTRVQPPTGVKCDHGGFQSDTSTYIYDSADSRNIVELGNCAKDNTVNNLHSPPFDSRKECVGNSAEPRDLKESDRAFFGRFSDLYSIGLSESRLCKGDPGSQGRGAHEADRPITRLTHSERLSEKTSARDARETKVAAKTAEPGANFKRPPKLSDKAISHLLAFQPGRNPSIHGVAPSHAGYSRFGAAVPSAKLSRSRGAQGHPVGGARGHARGSVQGHARGKIPTALGPRKMKLRERLVIGLSISAVLFTLVLVIDLQLDIGMSGHHLQSLPAHARLKYGDQGVDSVRSIYNSFGRKFLQRNSGGDASVQNNSGGGQLDKVRSSTRTYFVTNKVHDRFRDLEEYMFNNPNDGTRGDSAGIEPIVVKTTEEDDAKDDHATIGQLLNQNLRPNATVLEQFQLSISRMEMYKEDDPLVERLLDNMAKNKIVHVSQKDGGTQIKLIIDYENSEQALFKPQR